MTDDIDRLSSCVVDAGARGPCLSTGSWSRSVGTSGVGSPTGSTFDGGPRKTRKQPQNSAPRKRRSRRAAIVWLAAGLFGAAHHEALPRMVPSTEIADRAMSGAGRATVQNAASDPGVEVARAEPTRSAAPQRPEVREQPSQPARSMPKPQRVAPVTRGGSAPITPEDALDLGFLDRTIIQQYVRRNLEKIRHCYETRRRLDQTLAGELETNFVILPSGSVASVAASGLDSEVAACVVDVLETLRFPRSGGKTEVSYPFHFVARPPSVPHVPIEVR